MHRYTITGIENGTITKDRTTFELNLWTNKGPLNLRLSAEHYDHFLTCLHEIEYELSLLDPMTGPKDGEMIQIRAQPVDHHQIMRGEVDGVPNVFLGMKTSTTFRWFALDADKATAVQQDLDAEIPKLRKSASPN